MNDRAIIPTLTVRTKHIFKEIFAVDERLKQIGLEAEALVLETKEMYIEYGEDSTEELLHLESIAMKAKAGVLASDKT